MVREPIQKWLNSVFNLPVVEDFDQTKTEQTISYDLTSQNISVRYTEGKITFDFSFDILYRCPNGFAGIGFLSLALADRNKQVSGFNLTSVDAVETIVYANKSEMVISKPVYASVTLEYNQVRELIKFINFEDALSCHAKPY